jgi:hypothetical protein
MWVFVYKESNNCYIVLLHHYTVQAKNGGIYVWISVVESKHYEDENIYFSNNAMYYIIHGPSDCKWYGWLPDMKDSWDYV